MFAGGCLLSVNTYFECLLRGQILMKLSTFNHHVSGNC